VPEGVIDNKKLTPYRGLDEVLIDYAHISRAVFGDNFVGLYLLGSLTIGDFDLTSDVDFRIVTNSELSRDQVELGQSAHTKLIARDSRWVKHLEYFIFPRQKSSEKSSPYGPNGRDDSAARQLWYFNNGGSAIERSDHDNTLVTRRTLRYRSKAVLGLEPAAFAPEVTSNELRQEIRNSMLGWEKLFTLIRRTTTASSRSSSSSTTAARCKAFTRARSPPSAKVRSGPSNTSMLSGTRSSTTAGRSGRTPESMCHNQRILKLSSRPLLSSPTQHASLRSISRRRTSDKSSLRDGAPALRSDGWYSDFEQIALCRRR
jgi:hypothetical protein